MNQNLYQTTLLKVGKYWRVNEECLHSPKKLIILNKELKSSIIHFILSLDLQSAHPSTKK